MKRINQPTKKQHDGTENQQKRERERQQRDETEAIQNEGNKQSEDEDEQRKRGRKVKKPRAVRGAVMAVLPPASPPPLAPSGGGR